jgi:metal-responsive CopG/Arc/MetJ family transcriptional regulator
LQSRIVNVRLPESLVEELDRIVSEYGFTGRSELIRHMIRYCLSVKCYELKVKAEELNAVILEHQIS